MTVAVRGLTLALLAGVAMPLHAQATSPVGASPMEGDILVTARKREERLLDVPTAASVLSAATIEERGGATNPVELLAGLPSVRVLDTSSTLTTEISLRGSPTTRGTSGDPAVGLYRDGAYIAGGGFSGRAFARIDMFDIGRVEVLRGTQGALYGRNAVGGAVNIVSARPEFEDSGWANLRFAVGNEQLQTQAVANLALSDQFAVRLGVDNVVQNGGFLVNSFRGEYFDRNDSTGIRGQIRWKGDNTDIVLRGEHWKGFVPAISFRLFIPPRNGFPFGLIQPERRYPWSSVGYARQEINSGLLDINHDFGWARLHSITSYRQRKASYAFDNDGGNERDFLILRAQGIITINQDSNLEQQRDEDTRFFSQDVNLAGDLAGGRLNWLAGVEYFQMRSDSEQRNLRTPTRANPSIGNRQPLTVDIDSWALYGSLDFALTETLSINGEVRQTWDDRRASAEQFDLGTGLPSGGPGFIVDSNISPSNFAYNATLSWKLAQDILLYGKIGSSFRAGGFNRDLGVPQQPVPIPAAYDDEQNQSYELGLKGRLAGLVEFGLAAYQTNATDVIVQLNNGCFIGNPVCSVNTTSFSDNAGKARTRGIEAEASARLRVGGGNLRLSGSLSRQEGEATEGPFAGQSLPQIPDWIFGFDSSFRRPLSESVDLFLNMNYSGQRGGVHDLVAPNAPPPFDMDRIDNLNARAAIFWHTLEIGFFVTNLTDETYDIFRGPSARRLAPPRNWGFQLGYRW